MRVEQAQKPILRPSSTLAGILGELGKGLGLVARALNARVRNPAARVLIHAELLWRLAHPQLPKIPQSDGKCGGQQGRGFWLRRHRAVKVGHPGGPQWPKEEKTESRRMSPCWRKSGSQGERAGSVGPTGGSLRQAGAMST